MSDSLCLVLHRKSANREEVKQAVKHVRRKGHRIRVRIAWNKKDKRSCVVDALNAGAERVIAGGGDGTINDVVNALVSQNRARAPLGILPLGTANDFAHGIGLPVEDLAACLEIACTGPTRRIDLGLANQRLFVNVVSGGFGAEVTASTPQDMKKVLGGAAYTLMGLARATDMKPSTGRLLVPGEEPVEGDMLVMAVGNSRLAGGGFAVAPHAGLDDGLLDLVILSDFPVASLPQVKAELDNLLNPQNRFVRYRQLAEFTLEADSKVHFNVDGEPVHTSRMAFASVPGCLEVAVPG